MLYPWAVGGKRLRTIALWFENRLADMAAVVLGKRRYETGIGRRDGLPRFGAGRYPSEDVSIDAR